MSARVRDVMTTRVVAVREGSTFKDIVGLLTEYRVSAFPVLDDQGEVVGVVSEADLLSKEALVAAMGRQAYGLGASRARLIAAASPRQRPLPPPT